MAKVVASQIKSSQLHICAVGAVVLAVLWMSLQVQFEYCIYEWKKLEIQMKKKLHATTCISKYLTHFGEDKNSSWYQHLKNTFL